MQDPHQLSNRGPARKPGRPKASEPQLPATPVQPALVRTVVYENGLICPSCSQSMVPEVRSKVGGVRYLRCSKCQAHLAHDLAAGTIRGV